MDGSVIVPFPPSLRSWRQEIALGRWTEPAEREEAPRDSPGGCAGPVRLGRRHSRAQSSAGGWPVGLVLGAAAVGYCHYITFQSASGTINSLTPDIWHVPSCLHHLSIILTCTSTPLIPSIATSKLRVCALHLRPPSGHHTSEDLAWARWVVHGSTHWIRVVLTGIGRMAFESRPTWCAHGNTPAPLHPVVEHCRWSVVQRMALTRRP